jgi:hypothetical protein
MKVFCLTTYVLAPVQKQLSHLLHIKTIENNSWNKYSKCREIDSMSLPLPTTAYTANPPSLSLSSLWSL